MDQKSVAKVSYKRILLPSTSESRFKVPKLYADSQAS